MRYEVIRYFTDLQDNDFAYRVGDAFPRSGKDVSQSRIDELLGSGNKQGRPLIKAVEEPIVQDDFSQYMNAPEPVRHDYSKNDILRMSKANLIALAEELGIEGAADKTGGALKPLIIEKLGL